MLHRLRPAMYLLGVVLVVAMLLGARALTGSGHAADGQKTANPAQNAQNNKGGLIVMGTVDSDPSPVRYGLSPLLQSGTISKVWVKDGQQVKKGDLAKGILGDKLYEFDSELERCFNLIAEFTARPLDAEWPEHPIFGRMSGAEASRLQAKHLDHHLKQFGA